jgi:maltooligosyltrehalose trehalohydrolase
VNSLVHPLYPPRLGARYLGHHRCRFRVWAPRARQVAVRILGPSERLLDMAAQPHGYYELTVDDVPPGTRYFYRLDGRQDRPDPASHHQPDGVHEASAVVDHAFPWTDQSWTGLPRHAYVIYELHVGTYTEDGTFAGVIDHLDELVELGVSAIELMPLAQFPGSRNWGYDGVYPFAVQDSYGGPEGLKQLVDAAHSRGLAVVLDVVYNHLGPEGNYLGEFGHYFTDRHHTPWGQALNFDDRDSDEVRRYFIENALYWIDTFHVDALRLDAVHAIFDFSARPFLQELADAVRLEGERLNRRVYTIAESSLADPKLMESKEIGGFGLDSQWCDDLHHAIRTTLLDEHSGYYADYRGFDDLVKAYRDGFVQDGGWSEYRGRRHGRSASHLHPLQLVVCAQNHDQVGNRLWGERLTELVSFEQLKLAAALVILSPFQPMLFMGEEYGEEARFQFFISHGDPDLVAAVRKGRREEFRRFAWKEDPPDPQAEETFQRCRLNHELKRLGRHRLLRDYYRALLRLRRESGPLAFPSRDRMQVEVVEPGCAMGVHSWTQTEQLYLLFHTGGEPATWTLPLDAGAWTPVLDSAGLPYGGPAERLVEPCESSRRLKVVRPPHSVIAFQKENSTMTF